MSRVKIKWYGRKYTNGLYDYIDKKEEDYANRLAKNARSICPVDTGKLKASIVSIKVKLMEYVVKSDVEYAKYVEYGSSNRPPQPYLRPALNRTKGI